MAKISVHDRRRLLLRSGGICAFPDCNEPLVEATREGTEDTITGIECHIVAQRDHPSVARSPSSLSNEERDEFAHLIADRDSFANLVMMCLKHSRVIDDPAQGYTVEQVVEMKRAHEEAMAEGRSGEQERREEADLAYAEIVDEWDRRLNLDDWDREMSPLVADGHPRLGKEKFDALTEVREWLFKRVWPGTNRDLEEAFLNFRLVCQDLQAVLSQHPHEHLAEQGLVAITRFYNDPRWIRAQEGEPDFQALDDLYDFYSYLVEDLTYELTRAANLVCDTVRQTLDPRYRIDEGVLTLTAGPFMEDLSVRTARPHYAADAGTRPYEGLMAFLEARAGRDIVRGEGGAPEGVRLPGEPIFGP